MKFRKKPVVIEAFQMTKEQREDTSEWPEWLNRAWSASWPEVGSVSFYTPTRELLISTLEGEQKVSYGDWIIKGIKGELYPCKPDIFEATYEKVEE